MIGLYVTVPVACFRRGLAREYLETERLPLPRPATASCCRWLVKPAAHGTLAVAWRRECSASQAKAWFSARFGA